MHPFQGRGAMTGAGVVSCCLIVFSVFTATTAAAEPPEELAPFFYITETRLGMEAANLEGSVEEDARFVINGEALFGKLGHEYNNAVWDIILRPRPHIGFQLSPEGGTNQFYAGVTWEVPLTSWAFIETSFGGALHDGPTDGDDPNSYGCALNFRESASLGFNLDEHTRLLFTVDHMSNGGLCDQNQGITNAGVRVGYRW
jgi:hypothetical protein